MAQYQREPASSSGSIELSKDSEVLQSLRQLRMKIGTCKERVSMLQDSLTPILAVQPPSTVDENAKEPTIVRCPLAMEIKGDCDRLDDLENAILALKERIKL